MSGTTIMIDASASEKKMSAANLEKRCEKIQNDFLKKMHREFYYNSKAHTFLITREQEVELFEKFGADAWIETRGRMDLNTIADATFGVRRFLTRNGKPFCEQKYWITRTKANVLTEKEMKANEVSEEKVSAASEASEASEKKVSEANLKIERAAEDTDDDCVRKLCAFYYERMKQQSADKCFDISRDDYAQLCAKFSADLCVKAEAKCYLGYTCPNEDIIRYWMRDRAAFEAMMASDASFADQLRTEAEKSLKNGIDKLKKKVRDECLEAASKNGSRAFVLRSFDETFDNFTIMQEIGASLGLKVYVSVENSVSAYKFEWYTENEYNDLLMRLVRE